MLEGPLSRPPLPEYLTDVALATTGAAVAAGVMLFLTPLLERVFDVTTGMTLSELRDPRQPLLRQLQQQAPGTYNHSLNVASIAEAAADAIGADSLHLYVGALYHDIGKINKPDYFVENQTPGINRHDKLSPAMSLLVIMGHVKDGLELAREYKLPRSLRHYIESHHGETLVTYFFHQAKAAAEAENVEAPKEIEYRYPGPKPQTKEAAILMLCDAVEGATRTLSDPTSSRIAALVSDIAAKRLEDGQFDDSSLTFAELAAVEDAITKTLSAIYHGRIKYPDGNTRRESDSSNSTKTLPADSSGPRTQVESSSAPA
jgi:putative nucleotidyltransferase with HDIG domain